MPQPPYSNASFNANQIRQEGNFVNQVQKNQASLANSSLLTNFSQSALSNNSQTSPEFLVSQLNQNLTLAQLLLLSLNKSQKTNPSPRGRANTRAVSSGMVPLTKQKIAERSIAYKTAIANQQGLPTETEIETEIETKTETEIKQQELSKELDQRRQNYTPISQAQIKQFIEEQKALKPAQPIDFGAYAGYKLVGDPLDIRIPEADNYLVRTIPNAITNLNVSNSNFFEKINVNDCYFSGGNFSFCRFGDTTRVTFDGSDLTNADMSGTSHYRLGLGARDHGHEASRRIMNLRARTMFAALTTSDRKEIAIIEGLEKIDSERNSTKFVNVNLRGSSFSELYSNHLTDFNKTNFQDVSLFQDASSESLFSSFAGRNLNLKGAVLKSSSGQTKNVNNPLSFEEVASQSTPYVANMVQNNLLDGATNKGVTIHLSNQMEGLPAGKEGKFQEVSNLYNQVSKNFNLEFAEGDESPKIILNYSDSLVAPYTKGAFNLTLGSATIFLNFFGIESELAQLHELGHALYDYHPFEVGIPATKCSNFASIMCYKTAVDIMIPLDNSSKFPARIDTYFQLQDLAPQDINKYSLMFGKNPNYQDQDIITDLKHDQVRIIKGDEGFKNIGNFNTSSLPREIGYVILNPKEVIGTCFEFPCDPKNLAEGIEDGKMVVFYKKNWQGGDKVLGATFLFGGKENNFFVDGKEANNGRAPYAENLDALIAGTTLGGLFAFIVATACVIKKARVRSDRVQNVSQSQLRGLELSGVGLSSEILGDLTPNSSNVSALENSQSQLASVITQTQFSQRPSDSVFAPRIRASLVAGGSQQSGGGRI